MPGHDTPWQSRPGPGREAASRTHQLCTEGAAETLRVGTQPGVKERGPQADRTGTHSYDPVLKHKGCRPAPTGSNGPSRKARAQPLIYSCSLTQHPLSCLHRPEGGEREGGFWGRPLGLSPAPASPLPRSGSPWAHLAVCDSAQSHPLGHTVDLAVSPLGPSFSLV